MTAGQKAAATRRARKAAGFYTGANAPGTSAPRSKKAPIFAKVNTTGLLISGLANLEDALTALASEKGAITPEAEAAFTKYQKCKALALHPATVFEGRAAMSRALRIMNELVASIL